MTGWTPVSIRVAILPHSLHTASSPLSFDHAHRLPTAKGAREFCLFVERGHRSHESCGEDLECHASQGCLCHRQRPSHDDQGMFLLSRNEVFRVQAWLGIDDQRTGLRRARVILFRYLQSPRPGNEWKETRRPQPVGVRRDKSVDDVSWTTILQFRVLLTTMLPIVGPSRKSKIRSSSRADAMRPLEFSMRGMTRRPLPLGSPSLKRSSLSSTCVLSAPTRSPLTIPSSDRAGHEHSYHRRRYTSEHAKNS